MILLICGIQKNNQMKLQNSIRAHRWKTNLWLQAGGNSEGEHWRD